MTTYNYTPDYNDGSLTRGEACDMIADALTSDRPTEALRALSTDWIGHGQDGLLLSDDIADLLREYIWEACMDLDGDAIRSNGPKDSDYTGISS